MELILNEDAITLSADELVVYVRLFFMIDKKGYVKGKTKDIAKKIGFSAQRLKKTLDTLFEKQLISLGKDKIFVWKYEEKAKDITEHELLAPETENNIILTKNIEDDEALLQAIGTYYNNMVVGKGMPQMRALTPKRKAFVRCRLKEYGKGAVYKVIDNAASSLFLNGNGNHGFVADFEWIMRPNNFIKVLEGKYNGERKRDSSSAEQQYYQGTAELMQRLDTERKEQNNL